MMSEPDTISEISGGTIAEIARRAVVSGAEAYTDKTAAEILAGMHDDWPLVRVAIKAARAGMLAGAGDDAVARIARSIATADWRDALDEYKDALKWERATSAYDLTNNNGRFRYENLARAALTAIRDAAAREGE